SRSHPDLIKRLFELEVPEVSEGIVEIYSISREAGSRTKISVFSRDPEVDPLGACVGYKGQRVNAIVDEIQNEKIDIVIYEKDTAKFIANSLSPSKVEKVFINEDEKSALAIVPDYQLSLAIGKEGQNVRLAAKLTGWKIDIKSQKQFEEYLEKRDITEEEFLEVVEQHAKDGVDFITIHVGLTRDIAEHLKTTDRITKIVSRGGSLLFAWMIVNNKENPLVTRYDDILDICEKYDVTLSLGDALRPGCINDATDDLQIQELINLSRMAKRAYEKNVQVMIEGPGHVPIDQIEANMKIEKTICNNAPFYVLGPLVTDIAPGYDHITSAIGGAIAASTGADFLCYVTPAEHLRLPNLEDMKEGIIATKIAAHAGDIAKKIPGAKERDDEMSRARFNLDWEKMFELAIDSEKPKKYRKESQPIEEDSCTMCGKMCSMRTVKKVLNGEDVN
ncbi:MAG: phosphomethylpyrimidine synthase ThiC, partial [Finegoldia magna]|nr:phosphomethylpyrimidine synthase ThiC [Finegoldia magna]